MKATKKIVGAACALVAAVALSAGSTFAWFAQNAKVTVTGVEVKASVPTNLYIEKGYKSTVNDVNLTTIKFDDESAKLKALTPAAVLTADVTESDTGVDLTGKEGDEVKSYKDTEGSFDLYLFTAPDATVAGKWETAPTPLSPGKPKDLVQIAKGKVDSTDAAKFAWDETEGNRDADAKVTAADCIATFDMTLANKTNAIGISATVDVTGTTDDETLTFVRTGFLVGVQDNDTDETMTYSFVSLPNSSVISGTTTQFVYNNLIASFNGNTIATVTFMVWFDGNDTDCFVNHAKTVDDIEFSITFNTAAGAVPGG